MSEFFIYAMANFSWYGNPTPKNILGVHWDMVVPGTFKRSVSENAIVINGIVKNAIVKNAIVKNAIVKNAIVKKNIVKNGIVKKRNIYQKIVKNANECLKKSSKKPFHLIYNPSNWDTCHLV